MLTTEMSGNHIYESLTTSLLSNEPIIAHEQLEFDAKLGCTQA